MENRKSTKPKAARGRGNFKSLKEPGFSRSPEREILFKRACATQAKKKLGQNFLIEPNILRSIADSIDLQEGDVVVEIGPGLGFLTEYLIKSKARVYGIELDRDMVEELANLKAPNLTVIHKDFLSFDLNEIPPGKDGTIKVIGNVPYQITSPIIAHVFGEIGRPSPWFERIDSLTMMVQKELAYRLSAQPGNKQYGMLTLLAKYFSLAKLLFEVRAEEFIPTPQVDSAVVHLKRLTTPPIAVPNPELLRQMIVSGFKGRRKMLRNTLGFTHLTEDEIVEVLATQKISPSARVENLPLETLAMLAIAIEKALKTKAL